MIVELKPIINKEVRNLCQRPYPGHPKGCPNYGKRETCPPKAPLISRFLDLTKPIYAVYNIFDFKAHCNKMKNKHPDWSVRQIQCVLYWQGSARKSLRELIKKALKKYGSLEVITVPEAMGVDITATMKQVGIELEWPPVNIAYQIALLGTKQEPRKMEGLFT